ncbi:pentapeptide repeat-containing protein [Salinibacterium sp.]|uniref:pentapeptide repeat-containing protein n=1 Tax=Salinibacterium sp. TaxID=1915057 RepID=UPI00286C7D65|nr:pentapeptide repeat-containing protein [Salinibacterium sp.]
MFSTFPIVRRLHELLWYLDQAVTLVDGDADRAPLVSQFERVVALSNLPPDQLKDVDIDAEFDRARPLLIEASRIARGIGDAIGQTTRGGRILGPGSDLMGSKLAQIDLSGQTLRGSLLIGADLQSARLNQCDLLGVDMRDANLAGADLDGAIYLTQMQVNSARGDDSTVLPDGFSRPSHWKAL